MPAGFWGVQAWGVAFLFVTFGGVNIGLALVYKAVTSRNIDMAYSLAQNTGYFKKKHKVLGN